MLAAPPRGRQECADRSHRGPLSRFERPLGHAEAAGPQSAGHLGAARRVGMVPAGQGEIGMQHDVRGAVLECGAIAVFRDNDIVPIELSVDVSRARRLLLHDHDALDEALDRDQDAPAELGVAGRKLKVALQLAIAEHPKQSRRPAHLKIGKGGHGEFAFRVASPTPPWNLDTTAASLSSDGARRYYARLDRLRTHRPLVDLRGASAVVYLGTLGQCRGAYAGTSQAADSRTVPRLPCSR